MVYHFATSSICLSGWLPTTWSTKFNPTFGLNNRKIIIKYFMLLIYFIVIKYYKILSKNNVIGFKLHTNSLKIDLLMIFEILVKKILYTSIDLLMYDMCFRTNKKMNNFIEILFLFHNIIYLLTVFIVANFTVPYLSFSSHMSFTITAPLSFAI